MQKHENVLAEKEETYKVRMTECQGEENELRHREEDLQKRKTETEALITRMYFDVLKLQGKGVEARDSFSKMSDVNGANSEEDAETREEDEEDADSPSGSVWPGKEPRQNKDVVSDQGAFRFGGEKHFPKPGSAFEWVFGKQPYTASDEGKRDTQGSGRGTSAKNLNHRRHQGKTAGNILLGTPPIMRVANVASGFTTPQSSSNTPTRTTSAASDTQPFLFFGNATSSPGALASPSSNSLLKAKSTSDLFRSHSSGRDQSTVLGHDPFTLKQTVHRPKSSLGSPQDQK